MGWPGLPEGVGLGCVLKDAGLWVVKEIDPSWWTQREKSNGGVWAAGRRVSGWGLSMEPPFFQVECEVGCLVSDL